MVGVGAAFDLLSGRVKQAPSWISAAASNGSTARFRNRAACGKRYFKNNPIFVGRIFLQLTGLRRYPLETAP